MSPTRPRWLTRCPLVPVAAALFAALPASAADVWTGANLRGAGDVGVAHPADNAAITQNPANLASTERYDAMGMFTVGPLPDLEWGLSLADSQTNKSVAFGLAYSGGQTNPPLLPAELPGFVLSGEDVPNFRRTHDFSVAVAAPFFDRKLSIGGSASVYAFNGDQTGEGVTFDLDVGVTTHPVDWFTLGVTGQNLLPLQGFANPDGNVAAGMNFRVPDIGFVEADVRYRYEGAGISPWSVNAGLEAAIGPGRVRGGYRFDGDRLGHAATWGIGLEGKAGGLEYAMQIPVKDGLLFADLVHVISLRVNTNGLRLDGDPEGEVPPEMWRR